MGSADEILLVYDRECPACDFYCNRIEVSESAGNLILVDARETSDLMDEITERGLDIDEGMVLKVGGDLHYGPDAIHELALLSSRSTIFNRLAYGLFHSAHVSRILYPILKRCRNALLKFLGKTRINNLHRPLNNRY